MKYQFGTDGIRGVYPVQLDETTAFLLGRSLVGLSTATPLVVIGRDTRLSGELLSGSLAYGIYSRGGNVIDIGIVPTNAVSFIVRLFNADYGVMVSASHNPPEYNGLKVFDASGLKLCEQLEDKIEESMNMSNIYYTPNHPISNKVFDNIALSYMDYIFNCVPLDLSGMNIAIDCAYGSNYLIGKQMFVRTNCNLTTYCDFNKGQLINVDCGATNPTFMVDMYNTKPFDLGFSFDGDADRLSVVEGGEPIDNNRIFYAISKFLYQSNQLTNNMVVGTVLTNTGVELALEKLGVKLLRSDVGDRNVHNLMLSNSCIFGGEESGHYLFSELTTGSDSLLSALYVSHIVKHCGSIIEFTKELSLLETVTYSHKLTIEQMAFIRQNSVVELVKNKLKGKCRKLVIRLSGTENKIRLLLEDDDRDLMEQVEKEFIYLVDSNSHNV